MTSVAGSPSRLIPAGGHGEQRGGFRITRLVDLTHHELHGRFLEGTGSVVFDHPGCVAYACTSPRTDAGVLDELCAELGYEPVTFVATDDGGVPVYHTNVLLSIGTGFVVVCAESVAPDERDRLLERLASAGRRVLAIDRRQMGGFGGNVLDLRAADGARVLAASRRAVASLGVGAGEVDDYAMIQETLRRRFKRGLTGESAWGIIPDLVLIDGGRGQLNAALEVRQELKLDSIPVASLAKENEDVFIPGDPQPVRIAKDSPALHVLQRARDEAHRFAIGYHRKLRSKEVIVSALDEIPGIGPKRKKALLMKFGSIEVIKKAPLEELSHTEGISPALAQKVREELAR